jgi:RNA polymerase sigma factor (sigma-70 family)
MNVDESTSDSELLVAAASDVGAFEAFYRRYVDRVTAVAVRRCSSAADVADVVAQTFVRLLDAAERYDPTRAEPGPFVFGITVNVVRELQRGRSRHRALVSKMSGRDLLAPDDVERIEAAIDARRTAREAHDALDAAPPSERAMVHLVAAGRSPDEAARELGISSAAGRARLSRARRRLRTQLTEPGRE